MCLHDVVDRQEFRRDLRHRGYFASFASVLAYSPNAQSRDARKRPSWERARGGSDVRTTSLSRTGDGAEGSPPNGIFGTDAMRPRVANGQRIRHPARV
jgi:hypothetical protein